MNRKLTLPCFAIAAALYFGSAISGSAQARPFDAAGKPAAVEPAGRPSLVLSELGLSDEQKRTIRRINLERRPIERDARQRFQAATRSLDEAIYAESLDEQLVKSRLEEFRRAQDELAKLKFTSEVSFRKILTAEQLVKFRELRRRFSEARVDTNNPRRNRPQIRRMGRRQSDIREN